MPYSHEEGKDWLAERIVAHAPASILDIGVGAGTYAQLLRPKLPGTAFIGVEVFQPYVQMFGLDQLYNEILLGDARHIPWPQVDVAIMGDVLEHMPYEDATALWKYARTRVSKAAFVSMPIIEYPQGMMHGNEYERHHATWTHDLALKQPGVVDHWAGSVLGCYELKPS